MICTQVPRLLPVLTAHTRASHRDVMRISKVFRKLCFKSRRKSAQPREAKADLRFPHRAGSLLPTAGLHIQIFNPTQISDMCNLGLVRVSVRVVLMKDWYLITGVEEIQIHAGRLKATVISMLVWISSNCFPLRASHAWILWRRIFIRWQGSRKCWSIKHPKALRLGAEWWENTCGEKSGY